MSCEVLNMHQIKVHEDTNQKVRGNKGFHAVVKNPPANAGCAGDTSSTPGSGRSPGGGNGNPLWYSCLENLKDRGARRAAVHGVTKSLT